MSPVHARGLHERGDVVGQQFGGVGALRLAGQASATKVHGEAGEVLRVLRDLEGVARLVGGQVGDEHEGLTVALDLVVDVDAVRLDNWHADPSSIRRRPSAPACR